MMMVRTSPVPPHINLAEKINSLINASGVKVEGYWAKLFAKAIANQNIASLFNFGGDSASTASSAPEAPKKEEPKEAAKPAVKEKPKV